MGNSPALPRADSSGFEGSSYGEEATPVAMGQGMMNSSEASTPVPHLKGKGGVLDDGQLTLREQEKVGKIPSSPLLLLLLLLFSLRAMGWLGCIERLLTF